jgi:F-type H+-transporting ATPase subunit gamma
MCGGFNSSLFRFAMQYMKEDIPAAYPDAKISVIPVGKKACAMFQKERIEIAGEFQGIFDHLEFSVVKSIMEIAEFGFFAGKFDKVFVVYNKFKNLISQIPTVQQLLPIEKIETATTKTKSTVDYIFEPDKRAILDELLPKNLDIQMWRSLLESNAAEQAARMMAMENATKNANELIRSLELIYNKERQAAITTEMLEIVSGAEALRKV